MAAATQQTGPAARLRGEAAGGLASAIPGLVHALTLGVLAFAPLGPEHVEVAIRAGFAAAIFGGIAATALSGTPLPATGPRASTSLILAGFVTTLAADPGLGVPQALALAALCTALAGALQILFGALRLGTLAKFVPYPVIAGFMCGVAILIVLSQLPHLLGLVPAALRGAPLGWLTAVQPLSAVVGLATAAMIWIIGWRWKRLPAALLGLLAGTAVFYALRAAVGDGAGSPVVGPVPGGLPLPTALGSVLDLAGTPALANHFPGLAATAAVIAIIGSLDSLLAAAAIDVAAGVRHRGNRELVAQGVGNIVSALFAGVPVALSPTRAIPAFRAGGRTRAIGFIASALLAAVLLAGGGALAYLPLAVLGGVMLTVAWGLVDVWTRGLVRRLVAGDRERTLLWSAAVVVLVAAITVLVNFVIAVTAGVFLSMALFIASMNRSLVRTVQNGAARPSRRIYGPEEARALTDARRKIAIVELEGALFFGSAERLGAEVEPLAATARFIVLDLHRVNSIDASGAIALEQLANRLGAAGSSLLLAGVVPDGRHGLALVAAGTYSKAEARRWFVDADQAIGWAEDRLLGPARSVSSKEIPLERLALAAGLSEDELASLRRSLRRAELNADEVLFREGEPGDKLYLLARGAVSILVHGGGQQRRIVTFAPGSVFGEAAMLDGAPRSATATVIEDAIVYSLSRRALDALARSDPSLATKLLVNLGRHLSARLRQTTDTLRELVDSRG
ncbi:MAG TPA: SulP family inorganic anion transporter [Burkholderiales bacterium]|nr:SulP family inorganic anion transporter [Burkholderiales bacterium]